MALHYVGPYLAGKGLNELADIPYNYYLWEGAQQTARRSALKPSNAEAIYRNARANIFKLALRSKEDPSDKIYVQYNPTEIIDNRSADYEMQETQGRATKEPQYKGGGERTISFQLWLNAWKDHHPNIDGRTPEETILWLREKQEPRGGAAPPILELIWREITEVVLVDVNITRSVMRGSLEANPSAGRSASDLLRLNEIYAESFRARMAKMKRLPPKAFDALRATIDITLKVYASANDESAQSGFAAAFRRGYTSGLWG